MDGKDFGLFIGLFYAGVVMMCLALGVWVELQLW